MTDPVVPAVAPKPVVPAPSAVVVAPPTTIAKAPDVKPEEKTDVKSDPAIATGEPHPEPEPKAKTPAARLDAIEARLAYLTALYGWPTEEHDEKLAEKAKAEQVDFAGNPVKAA